MSSAGGGYGTYIQLAFSIGMMIYNWVSADESENDIDTQELEYNNYTRNAPVPLVYGTDKYSGTILFIGNTWVDTENSEGGKGFFMNMFSSSGGESGTEGTAIPKYFAEFGMGLGEGEFNYLINIFINNDTIIDEYLSALSYIFYKGTIDQTIDPLLLAFAGVDAIPFKHTAYLSFSGSLGEINQIPIVTVEAAGLLTYQGVDLGDNWTEIYQDNDGLSETYYEIWKDSFGDVYYSFRRNNGLVTYLLEDNQATKICETTNTFPSVGSAVLDPYENVDGLRFVFYTENVNNGIGYCNLPRIRLINLYDGTIVRTVTPFPKVNNIYVELCSVAGTGSKYFIDNYSITIIINAGSYLVFENYNYILSNRSETIVSPNIYSDLNFLDDRSIRVGGTGYVRYTSTADGENYIGIASARGISSLYVMPTGETGFSVIYGVDEEFDYLVTGITGYYKIYKILDDEGNLELVLTIDEVLGSTAAGVTWKSINKSVFLSCAYSIPGGASPSWNMKIMYKINLLNYTYEQLPLYDDYTGGQYESRFEFTSSGIINANAYYYPTAANFVSFSSLSMSAGVGADANPIAVVYDFLTNNRYGCGLDPTFFDGSPTTSGTWKTEYDFCNEIITYSYSNSEGAEFVVNATSTVNRIYANFTNYGVNFFLAITGIINEEIFTITDQQLDYIDITPDLTIVPAIGDFLTLNKTNITISEPRFVFSNAYLTLLKGYDFVKDVLQTCRGFLYYCDGKLKVGISKQNEIPVIGFGYEKGTFTSNQNADVLNKIYIDLSLYVENYWNGDLGSVVVGVNTYNFIVIDQTDTYIQVFDDFPELIPNGSTIEITKDNIKANSLSWHDKGFREKNNKTRLEYKKRDEDYRTDVVEADNFVDILDSDDEIRETSYTMNGIKRQGQATRMVQFLQDYVDNTTSYCNFETDIVGMLLCAGDIISVTYYPKAWSCKLFRVMSMEELEDYNVKLELEEYNSYVYHDYGTPIITPTYDTDPVEDKQQIPDQVERLFLYVDSSSNKIYVFFKRPTENNTYWIGGVVYSKYSDEQIWTCKGTSFCNTPSVKLNCNLSKTQTTIYYDSSTVNSSFPSIGVFIIEEEEISYSGIDDTNNAFLNCVRGYNNTIPNFHIIDEYCYYKSINTFSIDYNNDDVGRTLSVKVISITIYNILAYGEDAPQDTIYIYKSSLNPYPVANLRCVQSFSDCLIKGFVYSENCPLWLNSLSLDLLNNDPVSSWEDSGILGNDASQATPSNQPVYVESGFGGLPAVRFTASNFSWLTITRTEFFEKKFVALIAVYTNRSGSTSSIESIISKPYRSTATWNQPYRSYGLKLKTTTEEKPTADVATVGTGTVCTATADVLVLDNASAILYSVYTGHRLNLYTDNTERDSVVRDGTIDCTGGVTDLFIGMRGSYSAGEYANMDLLELFIFSNDLIAFDDSQRSMMTYYLKAKYEKQYSGSDFIFYWRNNSFNFWYGYGGDEYGGDEYGTGYSSNISKYYIEIWDTVNEIIIRTDYIDITDFTTPDGYYNYSALLNYQDNNGTFNDYLKARVYQINYDGLISKYVECNNARSFASNYVTYPSNWTIGGSTVIDGSDFLFYNNNDYAITNDYVIQPIDFIISFKFKPTVNMNNRAYVSLGYVSGSSQIIRFHYGGNAGVYANVTGFGYGTYGSITTLYQVTDYSRGYYWYCILFRKIGLNLSLKMWREGLDEEPTTWSWEGLLPAITLYGKIYSTLVSTGYSAEYGGLRDIELIT